jgi:hypothetical protein
VVRFGTVAVSVLAGVIPKSRAFTSGARDLARIATGKKSNLHHYRYFCQMPRSTRLVLLEAPSSGLERSAARGSWECEIRLRPTDQKKGTKKEKETEAAIRETET